jgi:hypothetical protein
MSREQELAIFEEGERCVSREVDGERKRIEELRK